MTRRRALAAPLVLAGALALLALLFAGNVLAFLYLAPVLVLGALLLLGRFPGERTLRTALQRHAPALRPARRDGRARAPRTLPPRGGLLLAARLAGRAPPRLTPPDRGELV